MRELTENSLYGIRVVRQNRKLLLKIETRAKKKAAAEAKRKAVEEKSKKKKKPKELVLVYRSFLINLLIMETMIF